MILIIVINFAIHLFLCDFSEQIQMKEKSFVILQCRVGNFNSCDLKVELRHKLNISFQFIIVATTGFYYNELHLN